MSVKAQSQTETCNKLHTECRLSATWQLTTCFLMALYKHLVNSQTNKPLLSYTFTLNTYSVVFRHIQEWPCRQHILCISLQLSTEITKQACFVTQFTSLSKLAKTFACRLWLGCGCCVVSCRDGDFKVTMRNFHFFLILAAPLDISSSGSRAYCCKDPC